MEYANSAGKSFRPLEKGINVVPGEGFGYFKEKLNK
jgi:hypothetical protein